MDENLREEYLKLKQEILEVESIMKSLSENDSVKKFLSLKKNKAVKEYLKIVSELSNKKELLNSMFDKLNDRKLKCNHPTLYIINKEDDIYTCKCLDCGEEIQGPITSFDVNSMINLIKIDGNFAVSSNLNRYNEVKAMYDELTENKYPRPVIIKKLTQK